MLPWAGNMVERPSHEFHCPASLPGVLYPFMKPGHRCLILFPLAALVACGSSRFDPGDILPINGTYVINLPGTVGVPPSFSGGIAFNGSGASGVLQYNNPTSPCNQLGFPISGSIDGNNNILTLTSSTFLGNTANITIQLPVILQASGIYSASGTAEIAAGTGATGCSLGTTSTAVQYLLPYDGAWTGTVSNGTTTGSILLSISEPVTITHSGTNTTAANASGQYPSTATFSFTSATCSIPPTYFTGLVSGYNLELNQTVSGSQNPLILSASESSIPTAFSVIVPVGSTTTCPAGTYAGTITR